MGTTTKPLGRKRKYDDALIRQARALAARGCERGTIQRLLGGTVPLGSVWYLAHRARLQEEERDGRDDDYSHPDSRRSRMVATDDRLL